MNWYIYTGLILITGALFLLNLFLPPVENKNEEIYKKN